MLEGVKADPPQLGCRVIAKITRDERMRCLMQSDGEQDWNYPGRCGVERFRHVNYLGAFVEIGKRSG
jgi:hypothetical protein